MPLQSTPGRLLTAIADIWRLRQLIADLLLIFLAFSGRTFLPAVAAGSVSAFFAAGTGAADRTTLPFPTIVEGSSGRTLLFHLYMVPYLS